MEGDKAMTTVIGLTGQSGAGKSTVAKILNEIHYKIIDADMVTREVYEDDNLKQELLVAFESCDRKGISKIVFDNKEKLEELNTIIFPYIEKNIDEKMIGQKIVVLDAPTLFESGIDKKCDIIISVIAPREIRIKRIIERDRITREMAEKRINTQHDDTFFKQNSDYVIENFGRFDQLRRKTFDLIKEII